MQRARLRVLVTGATGFVGSHLLRWLEDDWEVFAFFRDPKAVPSDRRCHWIRQDLREPLRLRSLPKRIETIVHLAYIGRAAPRKREGDLFTVNAACCASLLAYGQRAGMRSFLDGSSGAVYGRRAGYARETMRESPDNHYGLSKWQGESIVRFRPQWMPLIIRYYYPYGPEQTDGIVPRLAHWLSRRKLITVYNGGRNPSFNPVYIEDVCDLTMRLLAHSKPLTVNCAGPERVTLQRLAQMIGKEVQLRPRFKHARNAALRNLLGDTSLAAARLGWTPRIWLAQGLRMTFA